MSDDILEEEKQQCGHGIEIFFNFFLESKQKLMEKEEAEVDADRVIYTHYYPKTYASPHVCVVNNFF